MKWPNFLVILQMTCFEHTGELTSFVLEKRYPGFYVNNGRISAEWLPLHWVMCAQDVCIDRSERTHMPWGLQEMLAIGQGQMLLTSSHTSDVSKQVGCVLIDLLPLDREPDATISNIYLKICQARHLMGKEAFRNITIVFLSFPRYEHLPLREMNEVYIALF